MKAIVQKLSLILAIIGIFALGVFGLFRSAEAASVDELKQQIDAKNEEIKKIQEELRKYNEELVKTSQTSKTLKGAITTLNNNIVALRKQITLTETRIGQKKLEIHQLDVFIKEKESAIEEHKRSMGMIMQALSDSESRSPLEILLTNRALSDFFAYVEQNRNFQKELKANLAETRAAKQELESDRLSAEQKQKELDRFQDSLADRRVLTEQQKKEQQRLLSETKNQEKRYQDLLSETEKRYEEIQREIDELEAELRKRVDPNSLPPRRVGFLAWPAEGLLSQEYGRTLFARNSRYYTFHNGVDIAASTGTDVIAADSGKVIAVGNSDAYCPRGAYGKFIVIDHGNNLMTLYAHLSLQKAAVGDEVARGQRIGYMGTSGRVTGPHVHFTVYDARTFELRQSRVCGTLPYGGSVNPMFYL